MGQYLKLTQNITKSVLEWHPTILHDLHEAQSYLYVSTGTGPYNNSLDPIAIDEWWLLAETEVMEMAKRGVPGVFTYGYLRRLGAELSVLDRADAQLLRPLLRSAELRPGHQRESAPAADRHQPRMVPPESSSALH